MLSLTSKRLVVMTSIISDRYKYCSYALSYEITMTNGFSLVKYEYMNLFGLSALRLRTTLGSAILMSLVVGFLCISFIHVVPTAHASMTTGHSVHKVAGAPVSTCCDMGATDHIELWKGTLVGIIQNIQSLLALCAVVLVAFTFSDFFKLSRHIDVILALKFRQYAREHPDMRLFNPLTLAFASGILHPKTFSIPILVNLTE